MTLNVEERHVLELQLGQQIGVSRISGFVKSVGRWDSNARRPTPQGWEFLPFNDHVSSLLVIIPGVNDDDEALAGIAERCLGEVGPDVPLHFTRFYPAYKMTDRPPTPASTLERAREPARKQGIRYAYIGNIPGHRWENTYCHNCGELLIQRYGFDILKYRITEGKRCRVRYRDSNLRSIRQICRRLKKRQQSICFGHGSAGLATCRIHSFPIRCEQAVSMKEIY